MSTTKEPPRITIETKKSVKVAFLRKLKKQGYTLSGIIHRWIEEFMQDQKQ
jgi:hypothetical protein